MQEESGSLTSGSGLDLEEEGLDGLEEEEQGLASDDDDDF